MWPSPRRAPRDCEAGMSEMTGWLLVWPILLPVLASALAVVAWGRERTQTLIGFAGLLAQCVAALALFVPVSYTHLTLPTIYSV